jgi:hypothetical protein
MPEHLHHRSTDVCDDCSLPERVVKIEFALLGDYGKAGLVTRTVDLEKAVTTISTGIKKSHDFVRNVMLSIALIALTGLGTVGWALLTHTIDIVSKH